MTYNICFLMKKLRKKVNLFRYHNHSCCLNIFFIAGDDFDKLVRCEAIHLVDSVLEQSLSIVHSQQQPQCLTDGGQSESEHFAITSDISNGVDFVKSPTIESISGKSFDDDNQYEGIDQAVVDAKATRIDRRFERLSSQLDEQELNDDVCQLEFEHAMAAIDRDEVSQLQSDFSKMSWDESVSATTAEHALSTPDTDLQDLNQGDVGTRIYIFNKKFFYLCDGVCL